MMNLSHCLSKTVILSCLFGIALTSEQEKFDCKTPTDIQLKLQKIKELKDRFFSSLLREKQGKLQDDCEKCGCARGSEGDYGSEGEIGERFVNGLRGVKGIKGETGFPCPSRAPGIPPPIRGDTGPRGLAGEKGEHGNAARCGCEDRVNCPYCVNRVKGLAGLKGVSGMPGLPGKDGNKGDQGDPCP